MNPSCKFCNAFWWEKKLYCLPCAVIHIYCEECLYKISFQRELRAGDKFHCPTCSVEHRWPIEGVRGFSRIPYDNMNKMHTKTDRESISSSDSVFMENTELNGNGTVELAEENYPENIITRALKQVEINCKEVSNQVLKEVNLILNALNAEHQLLQKEINNYRSYTEYELKRLALEGGEFDVLKTFNDDVYKKFIDRKLSNRVLKILGKNMYFKSAKGDVKIGEVLENTINGKELREESEIQALTTTPSSVIYLTEKHERNYIYKIVEYSFNKNLMRCHLMWKTAHKNGYKLAVGKNIYVMDDRTGSIYLIDKDAVECSDPGFFASPSKSTISVRCSYFTSYPGGGVITYTGYNYEAKISKLSDPFEEVWTIELALTNGIVNDMKTCANFVYILTSNSKICILDLETGNLLWRINWMGMSVPVYGFEDLRFTPSNRTVSCLLMGENITVLIDQLKNKTNSWTFMVYGNNCESYKIIDYVKMEIGVKLCLLGNDYKTLRFHTAYNHEMSEDKLQAEGVLDLMFAKSLWHVNNNKKTTLSKLESEISMLQAFIIRDHEELKNQIENYYTQKKNDLKNKLKLAKKELFSTNHQLPIEMYRQEFFLEPFNDIVDCHIDFEPNSTIKHFILGDILEITNHKNNLKFDYKIESLICTNNSIILLSRRHKTNNYKYILEEYVINRNILIFHSFWITGCKTSYDIAANLKNIYILEKETGNLFVVQLKKFTDPEQPKLFAAVSLMYSETSFPVCCIIPFHRGIIMHRGNGRITKIFDPFKEDWTIDLKSKYLHAENMMTTQNFLFVLNSNDLWVFYLDSGAVYRRIEYNESNIMLSFERLRYIIPMYSISCMILSTYSVIFIEINNKGEPEILRYERRDGHWTVRDFVFSPFGAKLCLLDDSGKNIKLLPICLAKF
ncbi:DgyrCDS10221 [Dimorphilus gyrociliatus]|uniref:DgyrCDS10221 n=1 Tax=Dimorphilus gyrociliatus TaxID=2664684 RepID=A0A7I8W0Y8_9ANNE|nr:DgyrCDS10221 [Dimorphilus gyrociliatus]